MLKPTSMATHNVYLKQIGSDLYWSNSQSGNFTKMECDTLTCTVNGNDKVVFTALDGIDRLIQINDGINGTRPLIKSKRSEGSKVIEVTIIDRTVKGEIDRYNIVYQKMGGGEPITFDPQFGGGGEP